MIVKSNPEFGVELALVVPYAYWLHNQGKLSGVITSKGMSPYYYFCDNVKEEFTYRTIDNAAAGLNNLPNNWIHGINSLEEPGVLDYEKWEVPPYSDYFSNFSFKKSVIGAIGKASESNNNTLSSGFAFSVINLSNSFIEAVQ